MNVPDKLESQPILEKIMQTRVRNLLAQPGVPAERPAEALPPRQRLKARRKESNDAKSLLTLHPADRRDCTGADACGSPVTY